jgi:hypothetical protein
VEDVMSQKKEADKSRIPQSAILGGLNDRRVCPWFVTKLVDCHNLGQREGNYTVVKIKRIFIQARMYLVDLNMTSIMTD